MGASDRAVKHTSRFRQSAICQILAKIIIIDKIITAIIDTTIKRIREKFILQPYLYEKENI